MFPLYLDENAQDTILVALLRRDGVDCLTANEAGTGGMDDESQLAFATANGRSIVTLDKKDFQRLHSSWMHAARDHAGIIVVTSVWLSTQTLHAAIMRFQREHTSAGMTNGILFVRQDTA